MIYLFNILMFHGYVGLPEGMRALGYKSGGSYKHVGSACPCP